MSPERERVHDLVRRHGWNATAFQTLESSYTYAFDGDACVAYVRTPGARVVAGAPIAAPEELAEVTRTFVRDAAQARKRCCFVATEERFVEATKDTLCSIRIGEQPVWDPRAWEEGLRQHKSLREQLRRARAKGVRVRLLEPAELESGPAREAISEIVQRWLAAQELAPLDFLLHVDPFSFPTDRRCFVAEREGEIVAFAAVIPVLARSGWFLEDLVRDPSAPNGTTESLVDAVMRWAAREGCDWLTLGLAPLAGDVARVLQVARRTLSSFYDFEGLQRFKTKLGPHAWMPIYLSYPPTQSAVASLADALMALAGGGRPIPFLLRTMLRGPAVVITLFAALLVPWTVLLALAPAGPWFGAAWLKWAWVGFDTLLAAGLLRAVRRPTARSFRRLAVAATADAVLTSVHALVVTSMRAHDGFELAMIVVACVAPTVAACVLWGATRRTAARVRG